MASKLYDGYRITEMRRYGREYGIKRYTRMTGNELLAALRAYWGARRQEAEQAVIAFATPGAVLRHKATGDLVRVVGEVAPSDNPNHGGALRFRAEYVEILDGSDLMGAWAGRGVDRARYHNESNARADAAGHESHSVHMLWQYEAVEV